MASPERWPDYDKFEEAIDSYLAECKSKGKLPMLKELAIQLQLTHETLSRWYADYGDMEHKKHRKHQAIARVKLASEMWLIDKGTDPTTRNANFMWCMLKGMCGYTDKQQLDVKAKGTLVVDTGIPSLVGYQAANREADSE